MSQKKESCEKECTVAKEHGQSVKARLRSLAQVANRRFSRERDETE